MSEQTTTHKTIPFTRLTLKELHAICSERNWAITQVESRAIQAYFKKLKREPTDVEMETLAQTWSEHCKHKTFTSPVSFREKDEDGRTRIHRFENLLEETIFAPSRKQKHDWVLSAFEDNAGIIALDAKWAVALKVETHNHPTALQPYGGAATGVGGVVRDILGAGRGARPVANTNVFCVGPLAWRNEVPAGLSHPKRTLREAVAGVGDYGNRMGIPTVAGGLHVHEGFVFNPLVFCGSMGVMPRTAVEKRVENGDLIIVLGGRTGRDGIHGATFSSGALDAGSSVTAVQLGNPLQQRKLMDVLLTARDQKLYRSITDCGAGGFSSAVGELGAALGAEVHLEHTLFKHTGMDSWEIWLSESQERMVLAVPPKAWPALKALCEAEDVEAFQLGSFKDSGRLQVFHNGERVADLTMSFLHGGLPRVEQRAEWTAPKPVKNRRTRDDDGDARGLDAGRRLKELLGHINTCSRGWIIKQYDHEVMAQTALRPLQGLHSGPGDASIVWPTVVTGTTKIPGLAISHGLTVGHPDPYQGAVAAVDEALRNVTCVGGDASKAALLDNFCWGDPRVPTELGGMVRAALGCRDACEGYGVPFVSGKDSLNNTFVDAKGERHNIPGALLITAVAPVAAPDKPVTLALKAPGNTLVFLAPKKGGFEESKVILDGVYSLIKQGLVLAAHDVSEGGVAVTVAEMAFSGGVGAVLKAGELHGSGLEDALFGEGLTRFVLEVAPATAKKMAKQFKENVCREIGETVEDATFSVEGGRTGTVLKERLSDLYGCWAATLPALLDGPPQRAGAAPEGARA